MESFTGRLVGALGGSPALTPELDRLAAEGVLFANCFATGERTVQGLEAIVSSFPSLPGVASIRRPQAQQGFDTLATTLRARGYDTLFLYGGQGIFDDMRGFFVGNGFDVFLEEKDFAEPVFRGAWGVSDEDVFRRALRELEQRSAAGRPVLAVILTVSLHSPWEFPPGRVEPLPADTRVPAGFERAELQNFRYADWAVGELVRQARGMPFFDETVFVFVGDHGVHLRGRELVPVDEYRVPAVFLAPRWLAPRRIERVTSQLDVAPTLMGILGGAYPTTAFGEDVLARPEGEGFAPMVYDRKRIALLRGPRLGIFLENREELAFLRGPDGEGLLAGAAHRAAARGAPRRGRPAPDGGEAAAREAASGASDPRQPAGRISKRSAPSASVTRTRPPLASGPKSTSSARRSLSSVWITRASGRAPKSGE